ncbi:MAG: peptidase M48, partial [bacterium]|nr:peptidase M48 [bacterium]
MKNFFDHQDRARRQSGRLIVLFSLALLGILSSTYLVSLFVVNAYGLILRNPHTPAVETTLWHPLLFTFNLLIVLAVTGLAALHRLRSLRGGGAAVAE